MPMGPALPPHLAKRTRDDQDDRASSPDGSEKRRRVAGPAPPPSAAPAPRTLGPSLPPTFRSRSSSQDGDVGPAPPQPPRRVAGPAPPPAPLSERPPNPPNDDSDSDSSDDDFGPAPPPAGGLSYTSHNHTSNLAPSAFDTNPTYTDEAKKPARDEWMTLPPTQDDLAARMDPTKLRARKFNTGKSAGASSGGMSSAWTETPEQKLKRLQDEAMGIITPSNASAASHQSSKKTREEERRARKIQEKIDATRGKSLVEQHTEKGTGKEKEDDPSKRAFDYEKDMAVIGTANHKQRRDMLNKSKGFGDRFSGGKFL